MSKYDINAIRAKLKQTMSGKFNDPDEFKPEKASSTTDPTKYRFFILPPLFKGDELKSGTVGKSMEQFFISHANHWIQDKPHACPRVWDGEHCKICQFGFDLLKEDKYRQDENARREVIRQYMPTQYNMVNIYFTNWKGNPEDLRGKVKFFNASKTLFDQWTSTLMKEDSGDPDDPQAYGVFFDENAGFVYELQVLKQGRQNSYKTSKFLANGGKPVPMIANNDGSANTEMLGKLLRLRHNLWDKIEAPDQSKITKIFNTIVHGDDADDDGGFDQSVQTESKPAAKPAAKPEPKAEEPANTLADDDVVTNSLADEAPLKDEPKPEAAAVTSDDGDDDDIDSLLSQLEDDD